MLKKHVLALSLSLIVGLIFSISNIYIISATPKNFTFTPFNGGDGNLYVAQVKQIFLGRYSDCDPFIWENKNKMSLLPLIPAITLGLFTKVTGSISNTFLIGNFIFPVINFLLIYYFIYLFTKKPPISIFGSACTLFLYQLTTSFPPITKSIFTNFTSKLLLSGETTFGFNRLIPIQFTFIPFMVYLIFFQLFMNKKKIIFAMLAGLFSGLLAYVYFYHWSAGIAINFFVFLHALIFCKNKKYLKGVVLINILALLVSSFYVARALSINTLDYGTMFQLLRGRIMHPLITLRYVLFLIIFVFCQKRKLLTKQVLLIAIILAAITCLNGQLVFGFNLSPGHWPYTTFEPLVMIIGIIFISGAVKISKSVIYLLVFVVFLYGVLGQIKTARNNMNIYHLNKNEKEMIDWLNEYSDGNKVIGTLDTKFYRQLPVLTNSYYFISYFYSCSAPEELWQRIIIMAKIQDLSKEEFIELMNDTQFFGGIFNAYYNYDKTSEINDLVFPLDIKQKILGKDPFLSFGVRYIPNNIKKEKLEKYENFNLVNLRSEICRIKLDYLIVDNNKSKKKYSELFMQVFINNDFTILELKKDVCEKRN